MDDDSDGFSRLLTCEFDTRNLVRMGTKLWKCEEDSGNDNQADIH